MVKFAQLISDVTRKIMFNPQGKALMLKTEKDLLLIKSVLKTCHILMIDERRLFISLGLKEALNVKAPDKMKLTQEETDILAKFIQVYLYLDSFCGGNKEFIHHWMNTGNEYFEGAPREYFYTQHGIDKLYSYVQKFG